MESTGIFIPARMESSRFPGKALAPVKGVPMIIRCANNAQATGIDTIVCTDSVLISEACRSKGIECIVTPTFNTGTDRVKWASNNYNYDNIINLQGDEVLISTSAISKFAENLIGHKDNTNNIILNGLTELSKKAAFDRNNVKAVAAEDNRILYLSRKPLRNGKGNDGEMVYLKQLGLYGFNRENLREFGELKQSRLELVEEIEMIRWIENKNILMASYLNTPSISVDTPEDLLEAETYLED